MEDMSTQGVSPQVLIVDEALHCVPLVKIVEAEGFPVVSCDSAERALVLVQREHFAILVMELNWPDGNGMQLLAQTRQLSNATRVIIHTASGSFASAKDALNLGAFAYVEKSDDSTELLHHLHRANAEYLRLHVQEVEAEQQYCYLFERNPQPMWLFDDESLAFLAVNQAAIEHYGYSRDEFLSMTIKDIHSSEDCPLLLNSRQSRRHILWHAGVWRHRKKDGTLINVDIVSSPLVFQHRPARSVLATDVTERKKAEQQKTEEALQGLSRRILDAQEQERRHLARELHDELGQVLSALKLTLQNIQRRPASMPTRIEESIGMVQHALEQIRTLSRNLRPRMLDDLGLVAALRSYTTQHARLTSAHVEFIAEVPDLRFPPEVETVCFRVVQEALTNIMRHAQAQHVRVDLRYCDRELQLSVRDDGVGFDENAVQTRAAQGVGSGLLGMRERVQLVKGNVWVSSARDRGTEVRAVFPVTLDDKQITQTD